MTNPVKEHYQKHPYPTYPLIASVRRCDTYALNIEALWARFNHELPPPEANRILIAGSGTFAPIHLQLQIQTLILLQLISPNEVSAEHVGTVFYMAGITSAITAGILLSMM